MRNIPDPINERFQKLREQLYDLKYKIGEKLNQERAPVLMTTESLESAIVNCDVYGDNKQIYEYLDELAVVRNINTELNFDSGKLNILEESNDFMILANIVATTHNQMIQVLKGEHDLEPELIKEAGDDIMAEFQMKIDSFQNG